MCEKNPMSQLNAHRSLTDMARLFKRSAWIMLGCLFLAGILMIIAIFIHNILFAIAYTVIIIGVSVLLEILPEKYLYNISERGIELSEKKQHYVECIKAVHRILIEHDINTYKKLEKLKLECESILKAWETNFSKTNSKVIDMFIGVPLGALIASIIYANSNAVIGSIVFVILTGIIVLEAVKLIKFINYYSEGHFKDKYLLNAINELDYSDIKFDDNV